jgi:exonuclease III
MAAHSMIVATFNVNGVNGQLPVLLRWLGEAEPDIVCIQELKAPDDKLPEGALEAAGYGAIWHGQRAWNGVAILSRGEKPVETRRGLPGDSDDTQSRYIEAAVKGILVGCLYLPNGNPAPGLKFDYKLRWFDCLLAHGSELLATGLPSALVGGLQRHANRAERLQAEAVDGRCGIPPRGPVGIPAFARPGVGRMPSDRCNRASGFLRFGITSGTPTAVTQGYASTTSC